MSLADLIRKRGNKPVATATPATPATQQEPKSVTVAKVARVAVANLPASKPAPVKPWQVVPASGEPDPPTFAQKIELTWLVSTIHSAQGDPEKVIAECVQDALARPEAALECYRGLWARRESRGAKHGD